MKGPSFAGQKDLEAQELKLATDAGAVQACGTPSFLKRRFGCGYVLTVVLWHEQRGRVGFWGV